MTMEKRPVALVTGGSRGIGLATAKALAASGFGVAVTGIVEPEAAGEALDDIRNNGGEAAYFQADLSDVSGHSATVAQVLSHFGDIDCLVNNAGMASVVRGDFLDLSPENYDTIMATNLRGTVFFTQAVLRRMLEVDRTVVARSIINITSISAVLTSPERLDYCISKAGLAAFTQGLTLRLAESGISVFEVRPGIIRTAMTAAVADRYDALIADGLVPMKRWGEAGDIGGMVAALASGKFAFATGSVIDADGGLSIGRL